MGPTGDPSFSGAKAKDAIRDHGERVNWWTIVWGKGHVPKLAFILWMAFKKKPLTKSRLKMWGHIQDDTCCL